MKNRFIRGVRDGQIVDHGDAPERTDVRRVLVEATEDIVRVRASYLETVEDDSACVGLAHPEEVRAGRCDDRVVGADGRRARKGAQHRNRVARVGSDLEVGADRRAVAALSGDVDVTPEQLVDGPALAGIHQDREVPADGAAGGVAAALLAPHPVRNDGLVLGMRPDDSGDFVVAGATGIHREPLISERLIPPGVGGVQAHAAAAAILVEERGGRREVPQRNGRVGLGVLEAAGADGAVPRIVAAECVVGSAVAQQIEALGIEAARVRGDDDVGEHPREISGHRGGL